VIVIDVSALALALLDDGPAGKRARAVLSGDTDWAADQRSGQHLPVKETSASASAESGRWTTHGCHLYDSYMKEMAVSEARGHLADLIDTTHRSGEPVYVTRRGRRVAVILDPDSYERLLVEVEDAVDRAELRAAREDDDYVPWDEVKAELGFT
jgi:antitoxin Phd